ncbi:hypothetical protein SNEBB_006368 [Seison nebaliae]|nr:hypothetical protein SNEBB_006368 [Seison nebaliae]
MKQLSPKALSNMRRHKYSAEGKTLLDPLMQPFWNTVVQYVPMWFAPNLLTLLGLVANVVPCTIIIYLSPNAKNDLPPWTSLSFAIGLFIYQILDAIDGKQARRTNSSSPLGELFDHGCDSISTVVVIVALAAVVQMGDYSKLTALKCGLVMSVFYIAHWQTFVTGCMKFYKVDVTEAQWGIIGCCLATWLFGQSMWSLKIPIMNCDLRFLPFMTIVCTSASMIRSNSWNILFGGRGANGSTVANTSVLSPAIPLSIIMVVLYELVNLSLLYSTNYLLWTISVGGMVWALTTNRLIVAHMCTDEFSMIDVSITAWVLMLINQLFLGRAINEFYLLIVVLVYTTYNLLRYSIEVCNDICTYLDIYCFRI